MAEYRITEGKLRSLINETIKNVINEETGYDEMVRRNREVIQKTQEILQYIQNLEYANSNIVDSNIVGYGKITVSFDNEYAYDEADKLVQKLKRFVGNEFSITPRLSGPFNNYLILNIN